jgi:hypothetical protein
MSRSIKTQRLREKMRAEVKHSKQSTFDNISEPKKSEPAKAITPDLRKQIEITSITASTREDEWAFKVSFRLLPSKTAFSRLTSDVYFDEQKLESLRLRIIQGPLAADDLEFSFAIDMRGIVQGQHCLKVEMYELWDSNEKLTCTSKEIAVEYIPVRREDRLIKIPIMKTIAGADVSIVLDSEKEIYRKMEENMKKETVSKRDEW